MKKNRVLILSLACCLVSVLLWSACTEEETRYEDFPSSGNNGPELLISMAGDFQMQTRSQLISSEPMHHIEHLYAYLFAVKSEVTDTLAVENAVCIYEEKLPWQPSQEALPTFRCKLKEAAKTAMDKANTGQVGNKEFLWMVVGVDNHPETYSFPGTDTDTDTHLGMINKDLKAVKIALATDKDAQLMSSTELFAGYTKVKASESLIQVNLKRRVAGVICYLQDIPAKVDEYDIIGAELHCVGGLNRQASLTPAFNPKYPSIFLPLTENLLEPSSTKMAEINLKELGAEAKGDLLYIPPMNEPGLQTLPNTLLMGAYMLPIEGKDKVHFVIRLVGEKKNADGIIEESHHVFDEKSTGGYFSVKNSKGEKEYAILSDYVYNIGEKPYAADTDYDDPLSLKGKPIVVVPQPWDTIKVEVEFPDTQLGIILDSSKSPDYKCNCMSTDTNTVSVNVLSEEYKNKDWVLTSSVDWLRFFDENENEVETLKGKGIKTVRFKLYDYVNENSVNKNDPDNDFRQTDIVLTVPGTPIKVSTVVRQWNALIVPTLDEDGKPIGNVAFNRVDNGVTFNPDGTINEDSIETYEWSYYGRLPMNIFDQGEDNNTGDRGYKNYKGMVDELHSGKNKEYWQTSVVNLAHRGDWYVPARIEMHAFFVKMGDVKSAFITIPENDSEKKFWWTSTAKGANLYISYVSGKFVMGNPKWYDYKEETKDRRSKLRVRLARQISSTPAP